MNREFNHDDMLFDQLVDGELSDAERRRLLASLDERPDGWRRCALAFLESQAWSGDLGKLMPQSAPAPTAKDLMTGSPADRNLSRQAAGWLAIAASVLIAFTLGVMQSGDGPPTATVPPETNAQLAVVAPPQDQAAPAPVDDALTFWVRDETGQTRPLRVPLVDAGALDRELGVTFQSAIPSRIRDRLQARGYDVQSKRRYAPLWLENGRPMIVPVEDTKIVPVKQNVY
jgi:hypothetical protein